ncbi:MAG: site-2 protease family protein [Thermoplasmata archaeon]
MKVRFRREEIFDIIIATIILSIAFTLAFFGLRVSPLSFTIYFLISLLAVLTGFVGHEMLHKFTAFKYDYYAEFKRWNLGLLIALVTSFFGIVFAAPGATNIYGYVDKNTNGKIAASGPVYNLILGIFFISISYILQGIGSQIAQFIGMINIWLSFFNLWPIPPLDGSKVFRWNLPIYIILLLISGYLTVRYVFML